MWRISVLAFGFYNMDCMDGMKEFSDKYFDLAIVDPPYGSGKLGLTTKLKEPAADMLKNTARK